MAKSWKDYDKFLSRNWEADLREYDGVTVPIGYPVGAATLNLPILNDTNSHLTLSYKYGADIESAIDCMLLGMDKLFTPRQLSVTMHNIGAKLNTEALRCLPILSDVYDSSILDAIIRIKNEIDKRAEVLRKTHSQSFGNLRFRTFIDNKILNLNELENEDYVKLVHMPYGGLNNSLHIIYGITPCNIDTLLKYVEVFRVSPKCSIQLLIVGQDLCEWDSFDALVREVAYTCRFTGAYEILAYQRQGTHKNWQIPVVLQEDIFTHIHELHPEG